MNPATTAEAERRPTRTAIVAALMMVVAATAAIGVERASTAEPPNVVLINVDDLDYDLIDDPALDAYFPNIRTLLRDQGVRLSNLHVSTPLCGPSRAALFRSQYAHNTNVQSNNDTSGFPGGFGEFYDNGYTTDEIATWMQGAGYTTMLVGKYHHEGFSSVIGDNNYVPPGWDEFYATLGGRYYGYRRAINGVRVGESAPYPDDFRTDVESADAVTLLGDHAADGPMFLYLAPYSPHRSSTTLTYAARHESLYPGVQVPRTPDFNEADVSDKTPQYQNLPPLTAGQIAFVDAEYRDRLRSMMSVDDMVGDVVDELTTLGELDNTYIVFTSDNGYQLGHHRVTAKKDPWDRVTRVGAIVRGPGIPPATEADHLLTHIDIAPTIADIAAGTVPDWVDGQSFLPILHDPVGTPLSAARDVVVIQNWESKSNFGTTLDTQYRAIRGQSVVYVEWANGDREYYDLASDPYQLDNVYDDLPNILKYWVAVLTEGLWATCTGPGCNQTGIVNQPPETTLTTPGDGDPLQSPLLISGSATDDSGVARVEVIVRSRTDSRYWNGSGFQDQYTTVDATLGAPGATTTDFSLTIAPPNLDLDIVARAVDDAGTTDPRVDAAWQDGVDDVTDPETVLTSPTPGQNISGPVPISGTATDDFTVDEVRLVIRNKADNTFWNGASWQTGYIRVHAELDAPPGPVVGFSYSFDPGPGSYYTSARAYDTAGNYDPTVSFANYTVS